MRALLPLIVVLAVAPAWAQEEVDTSGQITLHWQIDSASDNWGFYLKRSESADGPWERVGEDFIPGVGTTSEIHRFEYVDEGLVRGRDYYYQLYEVGFNGAESLMGTLQAHCRTLEEDIIHERRTALGEQLGEAEEIQAPLVNEDWLVFLHPRSRETTSLVVDHLGWEESPIEMDLLQGTQLLIAELELAAIPATAETISYLFLVGEGASAEAQLDTFNSVSVESPERGEVVSEHTLGGAP